MPHDLKVRGTGAKTDTGGGGLGGGGSFRQGDSSWAVGGGGTFFSLYKGVGFRVFPLPSGRNSRGLVASVILLLLLLLGFSDQSLMI
jgi:hypothetical protein